MSTGKGICGSFTDKVLMTGMLVYRDYGLLACVRMCVCFPHSRFGTEVGAPLTTARHLAPVSSPVNTRVSMLCAFLLFCCLFALIFCVFESTSQVVNIVLAFILVYSPSDLVNIVILTLLFKANLAQLT